MNWKRFDLPGLALVIIAGVIYSVQGTWDPYQTAMAAVGLLALAVGLFARRGQIGGGLTGRQGRHRANSLVSVVLFLGVLGLVSYLGAQNDETFDFTAEGRNTLAEQSRAVAEQVDQDVEILAFYPGGDNPAARELLDLYRNANSRIAFEFVDPNSQPQLAGQYEVTVYGSLNNPLSDRPSAYGTLILEMAGFRERVETESAVTEEELTNALTRLLKGEQKTVYFVEGHGEKNIDVVEQGGLAAARAALERENYGVETTNLIVDGGVPADAAVLVWAGPVNEPFDEEIAMLREYLDAGGSAMIMLDPDAAAFGAFLDEWGIRVGNDFVVDASGVGRLFGAGPEIPLVLEYGAHAITADFSGAMTFFPLARSVTPTSDPTSDIIVSPLLLTGPRSWGETDLESNEAEMNPEVDLEGPVTLGVAATRLASADAGEATPEADPAAEGSGDARLVVIGDSEFASNGYFEQQGNANLFMNTVTWLAADDSFISIRPRLPDDRPLTMTAAQANVSLYLSMVLLPLGIVVGGISIWMKRRKL